MKLFEELGLSPELLAAIKRLNIDTPTQIQKESIPHIIKGKDVIGESETGSGKTLAFGCGIIEQVKPKQGIQALVLTPTRELAEQVKESITNMAFNRPLKIMSVYGGVAIEPQMHALRTADVVVATPGRLLDHLQRKTIDTSKVKILVLDEADRMFDMGFYEDVELIIKACPSKRQTLFFSATISARIKDLSKRYMTDPTIVMAGKQVDPSKLKQVYYDVSKNLKLSLLVHLLQEEESDLVMVFCNSRKNTDFVAKNLKVNKVSAIAIHGGFTQNKRTNTLKLFNDAKARVMVCTDVAARGLHIDNVTHVYNYDIPKDTNDYIHRIGRTARAGEKGKVINILCEYDYDNFSKVLREHHNLTIDKLDTPQIKRVMAIKTEEQNMRRPNRNFHRGGHRRRTW
jgi:ATP-dependent RNA helicase DeaD